MTETVARHPSADRQNPSAGRQVWTFTRHFLEMCVAMCVGGTALTALVFVAGPAVSAIRTSARRRRRRRC